jgi:hypothetical protein
MNGRDAARESPPRSERRLPWRRTAARVLAAQVVALTAAQGAQVALAEPRATQTEVLGPLTGHYARLHPANLSPHPIAYYGTDLGYTYAHAGQIVFLFGDTAATERGDPIQASTAGLYDDGFGTIDLAEWPDPARITRTHLPLIRLAQNADSTEMSAIDPGLVLDLFKTPLAGFSNGPREFALFYTSKPRACRGNTDCEEGLACDTGLGYVGERPEEPRGITFACLDGAPGCTDSTLPVSREADPASGFCVVPWTDGRVVDTAARLASVALRNRVGVRDRGDPRRYAVVRDWWTSRFSNVTLRTVQDFEPARGAGGSRQDYSGAGAAGANRRVLLWGRPGFVGVRARDRSLPLYFAYADLPVEPQLRWDVRYFAGVDERGVPQFSASERDAAPLDLDSTQPGVQPGEAVDVVDQASVAWVGTLGKWVMFYGGGMVRLPAPPALPNCGVLELFTGPDCVHVVIGKGSVFMRTADDPWGPWSPPGEVIAGGDPDASPVADLYAPGGWLHHPRCAGARCAPHTQSPQVNADEYGFLYGVNIIEQWLEPVDSGVDVIWNASTWDPYRVILLRTRITR